MVKIDANLPCPKYRQLADALQNEIQRGSGEVGKRFFSEREIIRNWGLSIITVRQALDVLVGKGLLRKEPGIGTFLLRRDPLPRRLREIGLFVFDIAGEIQSGYGFIVSQWRRGVLEELKRRGRKLVLLDIQPDDAVGAVMRRHAEQGEEWGGFIFSEGSEWLAGALRVLLAKRIPHVFLEPFPWVEGANAVFADHRRAGELAAEHLLALGHRRIAFSGNIEEARFEGFRAILRAAGCALRPEYIRPDGARGIVDSLEAGRYAARELFSLSPPPTAIFTTNDARALGVLRAARARGLRVPGEFSIVGVDDMPEGRVSGPPLTTIRWPWAEVGRRGARTLLDWEARGDDYRPSQVALPPELIARGSSGPAKA